MQNTYFSMKAKTGRNADLTWSLIEGVVNVLWGYQVDEHHYDAIIYFVATGRVYGQVSCKGLGGVG